MVVRRRGRAGGAVALAAALGVMAASGCSGVRVAAVDERAGLGSVPAQRGADAVPQGPADQVRAAADTLLTAGSARARTAMETATGGTRVTIEGAGGYDFRRGMGRLTVVLPRDPAGAAGHRPVTELMTPGALYMKNRGAGVPADKWVRIDTTTLEDGNLVTGGATDPLAAAELLRGAREVTLVGDERFEGDWVRHFRGSADIGLAARAAAPFVRDTLVAAAKGFAWEAVPFDVYLDDAGRLRKVRHRFSFAKDGGAMVTVTSTTVLYDFGTPVAVELPDARNIYAGRIRV
ncbi:hypothetical protein ACFVIM_33120 [Streptomyces sp. NPDC057638]|uniref:hypothetical protein n=1 Tax=Streptomyces sp. NPDC057638 TaxID=3346190 RepID=UPI0036B42D41